MVTSRVSPRTTKVVTPTLVADQVYKVVEQAILTGELEAGSPLRVRDVAAMVGTSVMPVREAISRLEEAGLAVRIPHRGAVVKTFTVGELMHIYDVRKILETDAARRGAPNVSKSGLRTMNAALRKLRSAVADRNPVLALDFDEELLRVLYSASGNPVLMNMIEQLWLQCRPYKVIGATEAFHQNDGSLWEPQGLLVEAVAAGDAAAAATITVDSLSSALKRLELRLEQPDESPSAP